MLPDNLPSKKSGSNEENGGHSNTIENFELHQSVGDSSLCPNQPKNEFLPTENWKFKQSVYVEQEKSHPPTLLAMKIFAINWISLINANKCLICTQIGYLAKIPLIIKDTKKRLFLYHILTPKGQSVPQFVVQYHKNTFHNYL